jgi:hypothetical protein
MSNYGFIFQLSVVKAAKRLALVKESVTIPAIVDIINPDVSGRDREKTYQRITMFFRSLEKSGHCTKTTEKIGNKESTTYSINFKILNI